jgi:hypothetical protein
MLDSSPAQFQTDLAQGYEDKCRGFIRGDATLEVCLGEPSAGERFDNASGLSAMPFERSVEGCV